MQHSADFPSVITGGLGWPRRLRILVVDDHRDSAELLQTLFDSEGHSTIIALNAEDALAVAMESVFDIAYIDIKLDEMNGYVLAGKLRTIPPMFEIPLVAMSGLDHETAAELARLVDFDYFLLKPAGLQQLLQPLRELVAERH